MNINNETNIATKIPIAQIIQNTLDQKPKTECEFNNMLVYNFVKLALDSSSMTGGKLTKNKLHKKQSSNKRQNNKRNHNKNKTRKYKRHLKQKGGMNPQFIAFLIGLLLAFVKGITNTTDDKVIERIKQANEVSDIFRNYYGTCTLNTMLFLKTIDLPTFEDLSKDMMTDPQKAGLSNFGMLPYLNKELTMNGKWAYIQPNPQVSSEFEYMDSFIERIKNKLISMREKYSYRSDQSILTVMNYPVKGKDTGHSVILWLTSENEVILIDPQRFINNDIVLYTSELTTKKFLNNDLEMKLESLRMYIRERIDIGSFELGPGHRTSDILVSLHLEIDDIYGKNKFSITNKNIYNTIARIKEYEEGLQDKSDYKEML